MFGKTQRKTVQLLVIPLRTTLNVQNHTMKNRPNINSPASNHVKCLEKHNNKTVQQNNSSAPKFGKTQRKKRPRINSPASYHVHHFLAFLQLPLRALDEPRLRPHGVVVSGARERPAQLGDLARGLVDRHHVPGSHLRTKQKMARTEGKTKHNTGAGGRRAVLVGYMSRRCVFSVR